MKTRSIKKDVAIIGMAGKFPKSENLKEFWKNLTSGNSLTRFYSDSELENIGIDKELIKNPNYIKSSLYVDSPETFDYSFFGYTKEEATLMDPQIRMMHELAWNVFEDAGYTIMNYPNKIGCFLTASDNLNWRTHVALAKSTNVNPYFINQISDRISISRLISYKLNLKGPSYFIDTACSSSLSAIHVACRSIWLKECTMAIAGGVRISSTTDIGYIHEEGMIYSKDGHCKAFDSDSSGTIMGEGAGLVVLKSLEDALNDRDHIYAVIRSSAVNNDGNRKVGYTAPSVIGQIECVKTALKIGEVLPEEVSFIEAHGTGTKLGDPIEIEALNNAFNFNTTHQCAVGSVKTNIGHLDSAAGVAGLIKAALSLKNKMIPPSLHFKQPNPEVDFKSGPFYVNSQLVSWDLNKPLIAGVSSLAIGGTNVHVILEEPPVLQKNQLAKSYQMLTLSAKTNASCLRFSQQLKSFLNDNSEVDLADLSYTLKTGRVHEKYRNFIVVNNVQDAIEKLDDLNNSKQIVDEFANKIVFMFTGQGSQYFGMAKDIYSEFPYFKSIMDEGFEILNKETGTDFKSILGYNNNDKSELINDTKFTQPILFLVEYAYSKLLIKLGIKPDFMIGHSLGEYVAACLAEVFTLEDGLKLISLRATLMSKLKKGIMLNVELPYSELSQLISNQISIAAINTESSCVISGSIDEMNALEELLLEKDINFIELKTSHAFHSPMMDPVLEEYEAELKKVKLLEPIFPFISSTTGKPITNFEATSPAYWTRHLRDTVNFCEGMDYLLNKGYSTFIEIGAAKTLLSFLRQNKNYQTGLFLSAVLRHPKETKNDCFYLLETLGKLWNNGVHIDWIEYYQGELRNKISAPVYSFEKTNLPARVNPIQQLINSQGNYKNNGWNNSSYIEDTLNQRFEEDQTPYLLDDRPEITSHYSEPESSTEIALSEIWKSFLGYERIGVNDDFFELGGDSLKGITMLKRVHKVFNIEIGIGDFFDMPTLRLLSKEIDLATEISGLKKSFDPSETINRIKL